MNPLEIYQADLALEKDIQIILHIVPLRSIIYLPRSAHSEDVPSTHT